MSDNSNPSAPIGRGMLTVFWILALGALVFVFGKWEKNQYNPNQDVNHLQHDGQRIVELKRNRQGHYVSSGQINGHRVTFMLDTGATVVAVPENTARKLGLMAGAAHQVHTANGTATAYRTEIATLQLGNIILTDLRASITPGMQGNQVLLGMSALTQLDFNQSGDILTLIQHSQ